MSKILAQFPLNLPELAERTSLVLVLLLVLALGFVLAWLIQAARRNRAVTRLIEAHNREQAADMEESRLLAEDMALEQANKLAQQARSIEHLKARLAVHIARTQQEARARGELPAGVATTSLHALTQTGEAGPVTQMAPSTVTTRQVYVEHTALLNAALKSAAGIQPLPTTTMAPDTQMARAAGLAGASGAQQGKTHTPAQAVTPPAQQPGQSGQAARHGTQAARVARRTPHPENTGAPTTIVASPPSITGYASTTALHTLIDDEHSAAHNPHAMTTAELARRAAARSTVLHAAQRREREALHAARRKEQETLRVMAARQASAPPAGASHSLQPGAHTEGLPPAPAPQTRTASHTVSAHTPLAASAEASYARLHASMQQTPTAIDTLVGTLQQAARVGQLRRATLAARAGQAVFQRVHERQAGAAVHEAQAHEAQAHEAHAQGAQTQGAQTQGAQTQGAQTQGARAHGVQAHGTSIHGTSAHGTPAHGTPAHTIPAHGAAPAHGSTSPHTRTPTTAERRHHVALALERERHTYVLDALKLRLSQELRINRERARLLRSYEQEVIRWRNAHVHSEALRISLQSSVRALETILGETRQQWAESQREISDLRTRLQQQQAINLMSVRPPAVDMSRLLVTTPETAPASGSRALPTLPMLLRDRLQHAAQTFRRRTGIDGQDASQAS